MERAGIGETATSDDDERRHLSAPYNAEQAKQTLYRTYAESKNGNRERGTEL